VTGFSSLSVFRVSNFLSNLTDIGSLVLDLLDFTVSRPCTIYLGLLLLP
jgi:hypothetical protein